MADHLYPVAVEIPREVVCKIFFTFTPFGDLQPHDSASQYDYSLSHRLSHFACNVVHQ